MIDLPELTEEQIQKLLQTKAHLHQNPEISWQEFETTAFIRNELSHIDGVEILSNDLKTGLIARIAGAQPGKCVALRADIDALEVNEEWESSCMSLKPGLGHACGHDFHTTALIGAAILLAQSRQHWKGEVILIFQPAEETTNGAREILRTGIFEKYPVSAIFGLHNRPEVPTGKVVVKTGPLMAAKINFAITVHGLGGHGSMPHKCVDPIVCAAAIVQNVLTIPARNVDPMKALVLSICSIHGGTPQNLIVDTVKMTGSMRSLDPEVGKRAFERLQTIVRATAETYECHADFEVVESVPAVINSETLLPHALNAASVALGKDAVVNSESCLATEDFADYMAHIPGFFYWLGSRKPNETLYSWHNSKFHTDDAALPGGARLLAASALSWLT